MHGIWDSVLFSVVILGYAGMHQGAKTRKCKQRVHAGNQGERDNDYGFFSQVRQTIASQQWKQSLTIYAQVQKSGVSSILSCLGWTCHASHGLLGQSVHFACLTFVVL